MESKVLVKSLELLEDKNASGINVIDFQRENPFTDYFVVCEATSHRQIGAIVDGFVQLDKKSIIKIRDIDGKSDSGWVAVDLYDVVVHIFDKETRERFELDKLFFNYPQTFHNENV